MRILNSLLSRKFWKKGEKNSDFFSFLFLCEFLYFSWHCILFRYKSTTSKIFIFEDIKMEKCIRCQSPEVKKNWHGRNHSQRLYCWSCHSSFTVDGVRGTYAPEFKQSVIDSYCHQQDTAQEVVKKYGISTRTLIKWKKEHQEHCSCGEKLLNY